LVAEQQLIEIARALAVDAKVILFDEPTAALAEEERRALLDLMKDLRARGITVVFVSHNLDEVLEVADAITVFRGGQLTGSGPRSSWNKLSLVERMLGGDADARMKREMTDTERPRPSRSDAKQFGPARLRVSDLSVGSYLRGVDLEVRRSEMLGIGGLVGSGRTTLLRALAGLEPAARGRLWIDGDEVPWPRTVRAALAYGIAMVPEDRKRQGLVASLSAADNIVLSDLRRTSRFGLVSRRKSEALAKDAGAMFGFAEDRIRASARHLSGGNQQKLLLARWRYNQPRILLADEPTRGIDIGAKREIMASLEAMSSEGLSVITVLSELEELAASSDTIVVLTEGAVSGRVDNTRGDVTVSDLLRLAFRASDTSGTHDPVRMTS
jgi:ABC-type sugar transport system ATPase subunit